MVCNPNVHDRVSQQFVTGHCPEADERSPSHPALFQYDSLLGTFPKLGKATISSVVSVYPHGTTRHTLEDFNETLYKRITGKFIQKIQVL